jgi:hypothetical protein
VRQAALQSVLNVSISDEAWSQATLPMANSGMEMHRATQITSPAFLSSAAGTQSLVTEFLPACLHLVSGTCNPLFKAAVSNWQFQTDSPHIQMPFPSVQ